ncbi:MAG: HD domain-containing protein [Sterolibacterium sp.]|nr:HD domain-containing protein [Sterolibacterium sp.]
MSKPAAYLKPAWARRQLELAFPLLPSGTRMALWFGGKRLAALGGDGQDLSEDTPGVQTFSLTLEGKTRGVLLLRLPPEAASAAAGVWGDFLVHSLQGVIEAEHARHSVAQETLASYREMALLQRAVTELNHSLKPAAVAASLLKEFEGRKNATDFGAVFLRNADDASYTLIQYFGENAAGAFTCLIESRLFAAMVEHPLGDILNNLAESPLWTGETQEFQSLLWLPLVVPGENLGMLVLASRHPEGFTAADMKRAQMLVSVAASALRNAQLYAAEQMIFPAFVKVIATAIDAKSPYTAGHCRRVPEIALMLAEKAHLADNGAFAAFTLDDEERNVLEIAAMLHDCGKMVTPEWVVDKATKLDSLSDRLDLIALRFEVLRRDAWIDCYGGSPNGQSAAEQSYQERLRQLDEDFAFLAKCNLGDEFISPEHVRRIQGIAARQWLNARGEELPLLSDNEIYNLCIPRGTLNAEERKIIEEHAVLTIKMLSQIPFPRALRNVTEYAGGHHERMDGNGYPRGLTREQLSIPARIMAIADIFEALTAHDRPYRKAGTLNWAIEVMSRMKKDGHIDGELFDLFLSEGVYLEYAQKHLAASQIDQVDVARYLG